MSREVVRLGTPVEVAGRLILSAGALTAEHVGRTIEVATAAGRITGEIRSVEHRREIMSDLVTTKVWLQGGGHHGSVTLAPTTPCEVIR